MKKYLEIRDSEGGQDAKLLVTDMASAYMKTCQVNNFSVNTHT